ncbi:hypothetical protein ABPH35_06010 [Streptococcus sp. ZJ93]|uniref:hypothetical protein n=1 Tax=Streptococcus handemini TaxID=3161188 RepID=UPI0034D4E172
MKYLQATWKKIETSTHFQTYQNRIIDGPHIITTTDPNQAKPIYFVQYTVETPYSEKILTTRYDQEFQINLSTTITGLLYFKYDSNSNSLETYLIDYSLLEKEGKVSFNNLTTNSSVAFDATELNPDLDSLWESMSHDKSNLVIETEQEIDTRLEEHSSDFCLAWACTKYKEGGGQFDSIVAQSEGFCVN